MFTYQIRPMEQSELECALSLVHHVFMEFEAPDYSRQGVQTFMKFSSKDAISDMIQKGVLEFWICLDGTDIVGVIALKQFNHVCMLFVDKKYHRQGIATELFKTSLDSVRKYCDITKVTVNSSPYAAEFYHKLGFEDTNTEQIADGIRFTPMEMRL